MSSVYRVNTATSFPTHWHLVLVMVSHQPPFTLWKQKAQYKSFQTEKDPKASILSQSPLDPNRICLHVLRFIVVISYCFLRCGQLKYVYNFDLFEFMYINCNG